MEGPEVVVAQVHQILQGGIKLLHDALNPRARDASRGGGEKDRWAEAPSPVRPPDPWGYQTAGYFLQSPERHLLGASPKPGVPYSQLISHTCFRGVWSLLTWCTPEFSWSHWLNDTHLSAASPLGTVQLSCAQASPVDITSHLKKTPEDPPCGWVTTLGWGSLEGRPR